MGILDDTYGALMDPATVGILSAAMQGLQASGPSPIPRTFGQIAGMAGQAGLGAYGQALNQQRQFAQTQALIDLEKAKSRQQDLQTQILLDQQNMGRDLLGMPRLGSGGGAPPMIQPGQGGQPTPMPNMPPPNPGVQMPNMPPQGNTVPMPGGMQPAPQAQPQPMQSRFDQMTAHLPPEQKIAAKLALAKGDTSAFSKIITEGHLKNVPQVGLEVWSPEKNAWIFPASQEEALAQRTAAAKEAEKIAEAKATPEEFTFGTGMNSKRVTTNKAIAEALRTGVAPDDETASLATQLARRVGYSAAIEVRKKGELHSASAKGLTGTLPERSIQTGLPIGSMAEFSLVMPGTALDVSKGALPFVPGEKPSKKEEAEQAATANFLKGRSDTAVNYERGLNDRVAQGVQLDARLDEMKKLMTQFKSGGGAEVRAQLARLAQAIPGIDQKTVDGIANGDLGAIQSFEKLQIQGAMENLRQAMSTSSGSGAGRITQAEFQIFLKANPNISLDPRGLEKIINFQKWAISVDKTEQQGFGQWVKDGKDPADYPAYFAENRANILKEKGISAPELGKPFRPEQTKFVAGQVYTDAKGNRARYLGNGKWQEIK